MDDYYNCENDLKKYIYKNNNTIIINKNNTDKKTSSKARGNSDYDNEKSWIKIKSIDDLYNIKENSFIKYLNQTNDKIIDNCIIKENNYPDYIVLQSNKNNFNWKITRFDDKIFYIKYENTESLNYIKIEYNKYLKIKKLLEKLYNNNIISKDYLF